jgi:hypothetical protein
MDAKSCHRMVARRSPLNASSCQMDGSGSRTGANNLRRLKAVSRSRMGANNLHHRLKAARSCHRRLLLVHRRLLLVHRARTRSCNQRAQQALSLPPRLKEFVSAWSFSFHAIDLDAADIWLRLAVQRAVVRFPRETIRAEIGDCIFRSGAAAVRSNARLSK